MKQTYKLTIAACLLTLLTFANAGCQHSNDHAHDSGTHRMGTPKENYQMSNEQMPGHRKTTRTTTSQTDGSGTHRMGTPKENYQMSNEQMRR